MAMTATVANINIEPETITLVVVFKGAGEATKEVLAFPIEALTLDAIRAGIILLGQQIQSKVKRDVDFASLLSEVIPIPESK